MQDKETVTSLIQTKHRLPQLATACQRESNQS